MIRSAATSLGVSWTTLLRAADAFVQGLEPGGDTGGGQAGGDRGYVIVRFRLLAELAGVSMLTLGVAGVGANGTEESEVSLTYIGR